MKDSTLTTTKDILDSFGDALMYIETKATPLFKMYYEGLLKRSIISGVSLLIFGVILLVLSIITFITIFRNKNKDNDQSLYILLFLILFGIATFLLYFGIINIATPEVYAINSIISIVRGGE